MTGEVVGVDPVCGRGSCARQGAGPAPSALSQNFRSRQVLNKVFLLLSRRRIPSYVAGSCGWLVPAAGWFLRLA
eukprot:3935771-Prymnesium_polylepis.1